MILSASVNADVPAHYGEWFKRRLDAGFLRVAGSDPWKQRRVELNPSNIDGIVFWTRDVTPFFPVLDELRARQIAFIVQYALTTEPAHAAAADTIAAIRRLVQDYGARTVVWRYDPLVFDEHHDAATVLDRFTSLANALSVFVDEAVVAFARFGRARSGHALDSSSTEAGARRELVRKLATVAADSAMRLTICADADALAPGASPARCIDARRLTALAGKAIDAPAAGFMRDCLCARALDIGDYGGSDPECFCGADPGHRRRVRHDPESEFLFAPRQPIKPLRSDRMPF